MMPSDPKKRGTGFTNISRILQANTGNRLGSTLQSGITSQAQGVKTGLQEQGQQFEQKAQAGRLGNEQDIQARESVLGRFAPTSGNEFQDVGEDDVKAFERFRSGTYKGPTDLDQAKTEQLRGKAQEAQQMGQMTQSGAGRGQLLQRFAGGTQYTGGQRRLDQLLLGQQGAQPLREAKRATAGITRSVEEEQQKAQQKGQQFISEAQKFGESTRQKLGEMTGQREEELTFQKEALAKKAEEDYNALLEATKQEKLTDDQFKAMGFDDKQIAQMKFLQELSGQDYARQARIRGQQASYGGQYGKAAEEAFNRDLLARQEQLSQQYTNQNRSFGELRYENGKWLAPVKRYRGQNQEIVGWQDASPEQVKQMSDQYFQQMSQAGTAGTWNLPDFTQIEKEKYALAKILGDTAGMEASARKLMEYEGKAMGSRTITGTLDLDESLARYFRDQNLKAGSGLSADIAKQLGLNSASIDNLIMAQRPDFEFERYINKYDPASITRETSAQQDQLRKLNALSRLSGQQELYDPTLAGTAKTQTTMNNQVVQDALGELLGSGQATLDPQGNLQFQDDKARQRFIDILSGTIDLTLFSPALVGAQTQMAAKINPLVMQAEKLGLIDSSLVGEAYGDLVGGLTEGVGGMVYDFGKGISELPVISTALRGVEDVASKAASSAWGGIKKIFCFLEGTEVLMADGTRKLIQDIEEGDVVFLGGEVIENNYTMESEVYNLGGVKTTGNHAIFLGEEGWERMENIEGAERNTGNFKVYPILTEYHLVVADGRICADYFETDWGDCFDDDTSLQILNNDEDRNNFLTTIYNEIVKVEWK